MLPVWIMVYILVALQLFFREGFCLMKSELVYLQKFSFDSTKYKVARVSLVSISVGYNFVCGRRWIDEGFLCQS